MDLSFWTHTFEFQLVLLSFQLVTRNSQLATLVLPYHSLNNDKSFIILLQSVAVFLLLSQWTVRISKIQRRSIYWKLKRFLLSHKFSRQSCFVPAYSLQSNWWINTFRFFKKSGFCKFLEHFISFFKSFKIPGKSWGMPLDQLLLF